MLLAEGQTPRDKYGRTLAWLWLADGRFVNALLVQEGYAQVYTFADNPDHAPLLLACQREAREASRGLWSLAEYQNGQQAASAPPSSAPVPAPTPAVVAPAPVAAEPVKAAAGVTIVKEPGTWPVTVTCNGQRAQTAVTVP